MLFGRETQRSPVLGKYLEEQRLCNANCRLKFTKLQRTVISLRLVGSTARFNWIEEHLFYCLMWPVISRDHLTGSSSSTRSADSTSSDSLRAHRSPGRCAEHTHDSKSLDSGGPAESRRDRGARLFCWRENEKFVIQPVNNLETASCSYSRLKTSLIAICRAHLNAGLHLPTAKMITIKIIILTI